MKNPLPRTVLVLLVVALASGHGDAQRGGVQAGSHVTIPSLAGTSQSADLSFEAAECEVAADGRTMTCEFQQVFLTAALYDAQTCVITTNRYDRVFRQQSSNEWTSSEGPSGECGLTEVTTLRHDGGAMWTMETRKTVGRNDRASCQNVDETPEVFSWRNVRRPLSCRFVTPGAMSR